MDSRFLKPMTCAAALLILNVHLAYAQTAPAPVAAPAAASTGQASPVFKQEQIDQLVAPIALYPDDLVAQILMAASYPIEIVQVDRWVRKPENAKLKGDDLVKALENETWDPSVKSLAPFPQVLATMSENLDWTQKLGDAVLAQQADVLAAVQRLRKAADKAGNLQTTEQQIVKTEGDTIIIQPANPQVVSVPVYNPEYAYGTWPYPSYPPPYYPPPPAYYPPAYYPYGGALAFTAGVLVGGAIWGWGNANWGNNNININNSRYNNINRGNINAGRASQLPANGRGNWQHNPQHRGGVAYRDAQSRQNFGRASTGGRQDFRGFGGGAQAGRPSQGAIGGAGANRPGAGAGRPSQGAIGGAGANRPGGGAGAARPSQGAIGGAGANRPGAAGRPSQGAIGAGANRPGAGGAGTSGRVGASSRPSPSAFSGMNSGRSAGAQASRGAASRGSMGASRGGYSGGGGRGGGSRGGGGGRGGGGRR